MWGWSPDYILTWSRYIRASSTLSYLIMVMGEGNVGVEGGGISSRWVNADDEGPTPMTQLRHQHTEPSRYVDYCSRTLRLLSLLLLLFRRRQWGYKLYVCSLSSFVSSHTRWSSCWCFGFLVLILRPCNVTPSRFLKWCYCSYITYSSLNIRNITTLVLTCSSLESTST